MKVCTTDTTLLTVVLPRLWHRLAQFFEQKWSLTSLPGLWYWPSTDKDFDRSHGSGGGAFRRYGPYCIDVMRTMFDIADSSQVTIVSATPETSFDKNVDDKMTVKFEITTALSEKYEKYNS